MEHQRTNERGNLVSYSFVGGDRYRFDFDVCSAKKGWRQYDTSQDASYFGVWVHLERRQIVTFAEGDVSIVDCKDDAHLTAELDSMADFYGDPPPAFVVIEDGKRTDVYDPRPTLEGG